MKTYQFLAIFFTISISQFAYSQELKPSKTLALLQVSVTNPANNPLEGESISIKGKNNGKQFTFITGRDGKYSLLLPKGDTYQINYQQITEEAEYTDIEVPIDDQLVTLELSVIIEPPQTLVLNDVSFETAKATLNKDSYKNLNQLITFLKRKQSYKIEVAGHTDNVGSASSNLKLSQERAEAVKEYLIRGGIDSTRLEAKGYGIAKPIADNSNPKGRALNRRTEIRFFQK
jgi:outer membrane protein OmpA-like peptidoglycan-associated protein